MTNYILSCCSTADMPRSFFEERNIPFAMFHYTMDGVEYPDDLGRSMSFEDFYARIASGSQPTTSQVNVEQFLEMFEPYLKNGLDILHVTLSSGITGVYNAACIARDMLLEKYPQRKIFIVDSLGASTGYGLLMTMAADLRDQGYTIEQLHDWIEENKLTIHHWFFSTDLTSYFRGGRISRSSQILGNLFHICPLLNMDNKGRLIPRKNYRGKKRVIQEIVERMKEHAVGGTNYSGKCYICHSACYDDAREVADLVEANFPNLDGKVLINSVGTVIGSHTGPGTVALFFVGDKRID